MALSSITAAWAQFDANANWYQSTAAAQLRLEAVQYLIAHRAQTAGDSGSTLSYESLLAMQSDLQAFLGAGPPRAFGLSRVSYAGFAGRDGIG